MMVNTKDFFVVLQTLVGTSMEIDFIYMTYTEFSTDDNLKYICPYLAKLLPLIKIHSVADPRTIPVLQ